MLDDAFAYAKEGIWGRWPRWFLLIISLVIFPLILGYMVRIFRGENPAPEPGEWARQFIDGLKLLVVQIIYLAPVILLIILAFIPLISVLITSGAFSADFSTMSDTQSERWFQDHPELLSGLLMAGGFMILLLIVAIILAIVITFFSFLGVVRFARTGSISEAFHFSAILDQVRRIGFFRYVLAIIIISVIGYLFSMILNLFSFIPEIGDIIGIVVMGILYPPYIIFSARYSCLVYDSGEEKQITTPGSSGIARAAE